MRKAEFNENTKKIAIIDPVRYFYIASDRILTNNTNYYICVFINEELVAFTNKINKLEPNGIGYDEFGIRYKPPYYTVHHDNKMTIVNNFYKLDLFAQETIIPFNILEYSYNEISFRGGFFVDQKMEYIDIFTDIYYEKKDHLIKFEKNIFVPLVPDEQVNLCSCDRVKENKTGFRRVDGCVYVRLCYHDSELADEIRKDNLISNCKSMFNTDNILKCMNGYCGLAYPLNKFKLEHEIKMDEVQKFLDLHPEYKIDSVDNIDITILNH